MTYVDQSHYTEFYSMLRREAFPDFLQDGPREHNPGCHCKLSWNHRRTGLRRKSALKGSEYKEGLNQSLSD